jgi:hypothetical protein
MGKRARNRQLRKTAQVGQPAIASSRTEAEVALWWLTNGQVSPEYCFLAAEQFCFWSPERADLLLVGICDGDPAVHEACRAFLWQSGAAFPTVEAVRAEIKRRGISNAPDTELSAASDPAK